MISPDQDLLASRLRVEAARQFARRSPDLSSRILAALRDEPARPPRDSSRSERCGMSWSAVLLAAAVLCALLLGWRLGTAPAGPSVSEALPSQASLDSAEAFTDQLRELMDFEERLIATAVSLAPDQEFLRGEALKFCDDAARVANGLWEGLPSGWVRTLTAN